MTSKGSNLPLVKQRNRMLIKEALYKYGPISRTEIADMLSLTMPTITTSVNLLISEGIVKEQSIDYAVEEQKHLGRRPTLLSFDMDSYCTMGVELGPYSTNLVLTNLGGNVIAEKTQTVAPKRYDEMLAFISSSINDFLQDIHLPQKLLGIGIGLPGFIDGNSGLVLNNLRKDWIGRNLTEDLSEKIGFPIRIENNVRARAIGAELFSERALSDPMAYYFVSYGLACSMIIGKNILYGQSAGAGEIGHMVVEVDGPLCETCGNVGCLESVASENAIIKRCHNLLEAGAESIIPSIIGNIEDLQIADVLKAQECDDRIANLVIRDALQYIGINIANIVNLISPENLLIDAQLLIPDNNKEFLLDIIQKNIFGAEHRNTKIEFISYDPLFGAKGSAAIAVKEFLLNKPM